MCTTLQYTCEVCSWIELLFMSLIPLPLPLKGQNTFLPQECIFNMQQLGLSEDDKTYS